MHKLALIGDLAAVWLSALLIGGVFSSLRLPVIAGYILVGILIGPFGLRLISQPEQVNVLAEFGVALLLFSLGVELSFKQIFVSGIRTVFAGLTQIFIVVSLGMIFAFEFGLTDRFSSAFLIGFICALSSTAVVTKSLIDRGETDSRYARILIPMLIIQDLALIPVMAIIPSLSVSYDLFFESLLWSIGKASLVVLVVAFGTRYAVPKLLSWVSQQSSKELFILAVLSICLTVSLFAHELGLSLALGAFLAGLMISESTFGLKVHSDIVPLKDLFSTVFFVSVGMLLNPGFLLLQWQYFACFCLLLVVGKFFAGLIASLFVVNKINAVRVGSATAQLGEFSFVLATVGYAQGLIDYSFYHLFLGGAVSTLIISPFIIQFTNSVLVARRSTNDSGTREVDFAPGYQNHLILKGFGRSGRHLAIILKSNNIPFVVIEVDGRKTKELEELGIPYIFGDVLRDDVLQSANIGEAKCFVITGSDVFTNRHLVEIARDHSKTLTIIARTPRTEDADQLIKSGANVVIQPEFEASIEISKLALSTMGSSSDQILSSLSALRKSGYRLFKPEIEPDPFLDFSHEDYYGVWYCYEGNPETIESLDIRKQAGITVLAVRGCDGLKPHPDGSITLSHGDKLYVSGTEFQLYKFEILYKVVPDSIEVLTDASR